MYKLYSLNTVKVGNWSVKASSFDDQIIMFGYSEIDVEGFIQVFYDEESAFKFIESLHDKNSETDFW